MKRVFVWPLLAVLTVGSLIVAPLHAQTPTDGINLQISPLPIELTAKPGTSTSADLRVRNAGTKSEKLQVRLLKVTEDNDGNVHLTNPSGSDEWVKWVTFSRNTFNAPPGAWQTIKMTVDVPKSAAFGYYFAVEYLRANETPAEPGKAAARGAVATFILLNADSAGAKRQAEISSFSVDKKSFEFLPASFTVKIKSTGNVHVAPHGNIFILKGDKQIGTIDVNTAQGKVLPGGSRYFQSAWSDGFPVYEYKTRADGRPVINKDGNPEKSLKWDFSKANHLRFGHYTAHLVMVYDDGQRDVPLEATVKFWVIPWRIILGLVVVAAFVGIGLWSTFRKSAKFVKRHTKGEKRSKESTDN